MKTNFYITFLCLSASIFSCQDQTIGTGNTKFINTSISVDDFDKKLALEEIQLIDVRTPEEFDQAHLTGALNYSINSDKFKDQIAKLDKEKPVLVYCLSGGRSSSAAELMASNGFKEIYNMQGGIIKWNAANKPLVAGTANNISTGLLVADFNKLLESDKLVLVDYTAVWCKPCKKMAPMLDAFVDKRKEKIILIKIDADENKDLLQQKGIESIPVLELYKNGKLLWKHEGEIDEEKLINEIKI
ncbi:MAG: thioredoxin domain-containing protein [Bacteroidota bacterium]|nr:thioredoxin domain-containing protein [Bacteroidota bacterium]